MAPVRRTAALKLNLESAMSSSNRVIAPGRKRTGTIWGIAWTCYVKSAIDYRLGICRPAPFGCEPALTSSTPAAPR